MPAACSVCIAFVQQLTTAIRDILSRITGGGAASSDRDGGPHQQQQYGLASLPARMVRDLTSLTDRLDGRNAPPCGAGASNVAACCMGRELWAQILMIHGVALRQLDNLTRHGSSRTDKLQVLLSGVLFLFIKTDALKPSSSNSHGSVKRAGQPQPVCGGRLALALIRSDAFQCYSRLLAAWRDLPPEGLVPKLRLVAQFSLIFSSCAQLSVSDQPLVPGDNRGTVLYGALLGALSRSQFLEHMCRVLMAVQERAVLAAAGGNPLPADVEDNIRLGVMEISGCLVSALHGIAGKQVVLESFGDGGGTSGRTAAPALSSSTSSPVVKQEQQQQQYGVAEESRLLLQQARAVLSGPCLQFLLGREIVASRLRLTGGGGPAHGLPAVLLPEITADTARAAQQQAPQPQKVLADRMLSRLGAASLVWHLLLPDPPAARGPPTAVGPVEPHTLPTEVATVAAESNNNTDERAAETSAVSSISEAAASPLLASSAAVRGGVSLRASCSHCPRHAGRLPSGAAHTAAAAAAAPARPTCLLHDGPPTAAASCRVG